MFSSKFWFTLVTLVMGAAIALLLLARNSYNNARENDTRRLLLKDRDQAWALLKSEARVRLDELLRVAGDQDVLALLGKATFTPDKVTSDDRAKLGLALQRQNKNLESYAGDLLVAVEHRGKSVAQVWAGGPDKAGYHLSGFPAVQAALRGFLQDDVWALSTDGSNPNQVKVYRVATRPVINSGRYVGAIVHGQHLDSEFASTIAQRLDAQVVFFRGPVVIASGLPQTERFQPVSEQMVATPLARLLENDEFLETGRSGIVELDDNAFAVYALAMGEASLVEGSNVGYAIVRPVPVIASSLDIVSAASIQDWTELLSSSTGIALIIIIITVLLAGFVFFSLEHGRPIRVLRREVAKLAAREVDRLNIYAVSRAYRRTAESINKAIDKSVADVAEKLGKKPADIDQILGPSDRDERVSSALFNFPDVHDEEVPPPPPGGHSPPPPSGVHAPMAPSSGPTVPLQPIGSSTAHSLGGPGASGPPPNSPSASGQPQVGSAEDPPTIPSSSMSGFGSQGHATTQRGPLQNVPSLYDEDEEDDEDEDKTEIAGVPEELLRASRGEGEPESFDGNSYFRHIFDQFVATKKQCGERTDNLQFERFSQTLRRNREALIERYGCKTVRFQVYVKEGKAALKATPVRN